MKLKLPAVLVLSVFLVSGVTGQALEDDIFEIKEGLVTEADVVTAEDNYIDEAEEVQEITGGQIYDHTEDPSVGDYVVIGGPEENEVTKFWSEFEYEGEDLHKVKTQEELEKAEGETIQVSLVEDINHVGIISGESSDAVESGVQLFQWLMEGDLPAGYVDEDSFDIVMSISEFEDLQERIDDGEELDDKVEEVEVDEAEPDVVTGEDAAIDVEEDEVQHEEYEVDIDREIPEERVEQLREERRAEIWAEEAQIEEAQAEEVDVVNRLVDTIVELEARIEQLEDRFSRLEDELDEVDEEKGEVEEERAGDADESREVEDTETEDTAGTGELETEEVEEQRTERPGSFLESLQNIFN